MRYDREILLKELTDVEDILQIRREGLARVGIESVDAWADALNEAKKRHAKLKAELAALDALDAYLSEWHSRHPHTHVGMGQFNMPVKEDARD